MQYTLNNKVLPTYYRNVYYRHYQPVYSSSKTRLTPLAIDALHYHTCWEIGICLAGHGVTHVDNRIYAFTKGDLQVIAPGIPHLSATAPDAETHWRWINVDIPEVLTRGGYASPETLLELCKDGFSGLFHPWEHPRLADILLRLLDTILQPDDYSEQEQTFLMGQLLLECARIGREDDTPSTVVAGKLRPAILCIREHFADKETMTEEHVAKLCNLSISHFRALFRQETGQSFRAFLMQTRLAKAAHLLKNTNTPITSIATETGFSQVSCLNRAFRKVLGQSPSVFRKSSAKND
jgi:AraC-like DNA-binding protein